MDPMLGKNIESYEIRELLGRGGMGVVYRAHDTKLDRDVAIKMMDIHYASDPNFLKRFQSEAKALARLQDSNIVSIHALLEAPEGICIVMEFVKGTTLAKLLQPQVALPIDRTISISKQLLTALSHAHAEGVIHRDIKPANIMVGVGDRIKIADFGLAKVKQEFAATATKGTAGTLYYMPPEQFRGLKEVDHRGDIYSAGMTLYECLTGRLPFGAEDSYFTVAQRIVEGHVPPPETLNLNIPGTLAGIVKRMTAHDPNDRYQSAEEVVRDLEGFERLGEAAARGMGGMSTRPFVRSTKKYLVPAAALGIIALGTLLYVVFRPATGPQGSPATDSTQLVTDERAESAAVSTGLPETPPQTMAPLAESEVAKNPAASHPRSERKSAPSKGPTSTSSPTPGRAPVESVQTSSSALQPAAPETASDPPMNLAVDSKPVVLTSVDPIYPELMKRAGVTGEVRLMVLVGTDGKVQKVRVQDYQVEAFVEPAQEAAKQYLFSPAVKGGARVRAWAPLRVVFALKPVEAH